MQLVLADESALAFWIWAARPENSLQDLRQSLVRAGLSLPRPSIPERPQIAPLDALLERGAKRLPGNYKLSVSQEQAEALRKELGANGKLCVLTTNKEEKRNNSVIKTRVMSGATQVTAFFEPLGDLYVSSPELVFAQLSSKLPLPLLTLLGCELCGEYSVDASAERGFYTRRPLMSKESAEALLASLTKTGLKTRALQALGTVVEKTASPAESQLAVLLCSPMRTGGFGFKRPEANAPVLQDERSQRVSGRLWRSCDLYWADERVDVEYDSEAFHSTREQRHQDSIRRNALTGSGIKVISVTPNQLRSAKEMRTVAEVLARALGKRLRIRSANFEQLQKRLRESALLDYPVWRNSILACPEPDAYDLCDATAFGAQEAPEISVEPFYEPA